MLTASLAAPAAALPAQAPPAGLPLDTVLAYAGVYVAPPRGRLIVSAHRAPFGDFPLLTEPGTGAMRLLLPAGRDTFVAGPELARAEPVERRLVFRRDAAGRVTSVEVTGAGARPRVARRTDVRRVPLTVRRDTVTLPGTLYLPAATAGGRMPVVVLAHGSEDSDRHSFGALPLLLAHRGIAAFAYDKRGTGAATGSWQAAGIEELALDLAAAVAQLRARADVDPERVCVFGFSEGGWVAPRAARAGGVACIVAVSGGSRTKGDTYVYKNRRLAEERGLAGASLDSAVTAARATVQESAARAAAGRGSGFDRRLTYDPSADWRAFRGPVLALLGAEDVLEDADAAAGWLRALFVDASHPDYTVHLFPGAHHGLLVGAAPRPSAFQQMRGVRGYAPGYWETLLSWLTERVAPEVATRRASGTRSPIEKRAGRHARGLG